MAVVGKEPPSSAAQSVPQRWNTAAAQKTIRIAESIGDLRSENIVFTPPAFKPACRRAARPPASGNTPDRWGLRHPGFDEHEAGQLLSTSALPRITRPTKPMPVGLLRLSFSAPGSVKTDHRLLAGISVASLASPAEWRMGRST